MNISEINRRAIGVVLNGDDPDGDVDKIYIPDQYAKVFAEMVLSECAKELELAKDSVWQQNYRFGWESAINYIQNILKEQYATD